MLYFPRYNVDMKMLLIILLFVNWLHSGLAATPQTYVRCRISPIGDPDLVTTYLEKDVLTSGCVSNATAWKNHTEIHVIRYHSDRNDEPTIELFVQDFEKHGFDQPFIIVLASDKKVVWQVRLNKNPKALGKHRFVVSRGSGLKFAYKKLESRPTIRKRQLLPFNADDLMTWVTKQFSVVTTFTSVQGGNPLMVTVGKAQSFQSSSLTSNTLTCNLKSDRNEVLNVKGIAKEITPVEGCVNRRSYHGLEDFRMIYVIELMDLPDSKPYSVHVEINRSRRNFEKQLCLVLKSTSQVHWHVFTTKIKAQVDIVANSPYVSFSGIKSDKMVQVQNEKLTETGLDLLGWVEKYFGKIGMYVMMKNSNRVQITLPEIKEKETKANRFKNSLTSVLTTHCESTSITVALRKSDLQALNIKKNMLTLIDSSCTASENMTHVYIKSSPDDCSTRRFHTQTGEEALSNTLVVHDSKVQIDEVVEGSGFDEIFSGSGSDEISDLLLDDEDLSIRPTEANFMCLLMEMPKLDVKVQLFNNRLFLAPYTSPVKVDLPYSVLYLEAMCVSDPLLRAQLVNCWFTPEFGGPESEKHFLIENSCAVDDSVYFLTTGNPQSERISFTVQNYLMVGTSPVVKLRCQISVCCIDKKCGKYSNPVCPEVNGRCRDQPRRHGGHGNTRTHSDIVLVETLYLPHNINPYTPVNDDVDDGPVVEIETNEPKSDERVVGSDKEPVVIEGLDSATVVGIAFAAFIIGAMMMGALWFIHTHSRKFFSSGPFKRNIGNRDTPEHDVGYVETTPGSSAPIST